MGINMKAVIEFMLEEDANMTVGELRTKYLFEAMVFEGMETQDRKEQAMKLLSKYDEDELLANILNDFM